MNGRTTDRNPQENCFQHNHTFGLWQVYSHFAEKIKIKKPGTAVCTSRTGACLLCRVRQSCVFQFMRQGALIIIADRKEIAPPARNQFLGLIEPSIQPDVVVGIVMVQGFGHIETQDEIANIHADTETISGLGIF